MKSFKGFLLEEELLNEALVTFAGKAYPKFNNIVILAGGAGSGKGFVTDKLLGIEGKILDVDEVKKLVMKAPNLGKRIKRDLGVDVSKLVLKNPSDVKMLHYIVDEELGLIDKRERAFIKSVLSADPNRKPNIIFDVTMKDLKKYNKLMSLATMMGYDTKNVHIVWVANELRMAMEQNLKRERVVPEDILVLTHEGASETVSHLVKVGGSLGSIGDFHIVFNKFRVDADVKTGDEKIVDKFGTGVKRKIKPQYIEQANYITVKKAGSSKIELTSDSLKKIMSYVPKPDAWKDVTTSGSAGLKDFSDPKNQRIHKRLRNKS